MQRSVNPGWLAGLWEQARPAHGPRRQAATRGPWGLLLAALLGLLGAAAPVAAQDLQPVPALTARVIDQTGTLDRTQQSTLEAKLSDFEREAGSQIAVLIVTSTQPEDIAAYAQRVGEAWKIGRREIGDGLLIVVAKDDRRMRIEVAKALEGAVPDLAARQVIDQFMKPAFRKGDYAGGLGGAVDALAARIRGEALPPPDAPHGDPPGGWKDAFILLFMASCFIGPFLARLFGRRLGALVAGGASATVGWWLTASLLFAIGGGIATLLFVALIGGGRSGSGASTGWGSGGGGWSSGGDGGGGFSSGGGGDFGGGGASGDW